MQPHVLLGLSNIIIVRPLREMYMHYIKHHSLTQERNTILTNASSCSFRCVVVPQLPVSTLSAEELLSHPMLARASALTLPVMNFVAIICVCIVNSKVQIPIGVH